jgi:hypothetical protein
LLRSPAGTGQNPGPALPCEAMARGCFARQSPDAGVEMKPRPSEASRDRDKVQVQAVHSPSPQGRGAVERLVGLGFTSTPALLLRQDFWAEPTQARDKVQVLRSKAQHPTRPGKGKDSKQPAKRMQEVLQSWFRFHLARSSSGSTKESLGKSNRTNIFRRTVYAPLKAYSSNTH